MHTPTTPYLQQLQAEISKKFETALASGRLKPTPQPRQSLDDRADELIRAALKALDRE
jgi:hypothetical protein